MATLTVGPGKQLATLAAGVAAARDGDTVAVSAGTYLDDPATIRARITLLATGGQVTLLATRPLPGGTALLTVAADATIDGFVIAGAHAADGSAAGVLHKSGALVLRNTLVVGNDTGLLALSDPAGTIAIQASEFSRNGAGDGFSHNIAVGAVKSLTILDSYVHDAAGGAEIRSRARQTTVTRTRILDNAAAATVSLDLPNGGAVTVQDSVIGKGAAAGAVIIRMGVDTAYAGSTLRVSGSTLVSDRPGALLLQNATPAAAGISGNVLSGLAATQWATGPAVLSANTIAPARPVLSITPLIEPRLALPEEHGRAGVVAPIGATRTVGAGGAYGTVSEALAAAADGDTIRVAAGTYVDDTAVITHRVIIEGVGGLARFVLTTAPANGRAQFVTTTDATFRNVEITGAAIPGGVAAAILSEGGDLTIVNSSIHDNQAGIVAMDDRAGSVGVYDTELARNGTPGGGGGNIEAAGIGTLTLRNTLVRDGLAGPEISSGADNTVLDAVRISQAHGGGAAALDLVGGGRATVTSSAIEKGASSEAAPLIQVGGGGSGNVTVSGTTLISPLPGPLVTANPAAAATGVAVNLAAPWGAAAAPAPAPLTVPVLAPATQRGVLALRVSQDAWRGDARFTITVDGMQVGGTLTASAAHGAGQTQSFVIAGQFAPGPHSVTVRFVNDLNGPNGQGRALHLDGATFNGEPFGAPAFLPGNGAVTIATAPVTRATPVVVNLSASAGPGDAQAFIAIDGRVLGGLQSIGGTQPLRFVLDLEPGVHTATVTPLNLAGGRRLVLDSIEAAGQLYPGAATALDRPTTLAFTVAVPPAANTDLFLTAMLPELLAPIG